MTPLQNAANLIGVAYNDFLVFTVIISQIFISMLYAQLKVDKNSKIFEQQKFIRKLFGLVIGLLFSFLLFTFYENAATLTCLCLFYQLSKYCKNPKTTVIISYLNMAFLVLLNLRKIFYLHNLNIYDIHHMVILHVPKQVYFNWHVHSLLNKKDGKEELPSLFDYFCYIFNYLGSLVTPVYNYEEYIEFIAQNYETRKINFKAIGKKLGLVCVFFVVFVLSGFYFDSTIIERPVFNQLNLIYQIVILAIYGLIVRSRYALIWSLSEISLEIANIRDQSTRYKTVIRASDPFIAEFEMNSKNRIDNWNVTVTRYYRVCFYEKLTEHFDMSRDTVSYIVFATSAFWHGFRPTIYLAFFSLNANLMFRKLLFKNKEILWFVPSLIEKISFDMTAIVYTRKNWDICKLALKNSWHFFMICPIFHVILSCYVKLVKRFKKKKIKKD